MRARTLCVNNTDCTDAFNYQWEISDEMKSRQSVPGATKATGFFLIVLMGNRFRINISGSELFLIRKMPRVLPQPLMRINVLKGSTVRMSKHNLIIYSLLLAAAPISVLADSSTTSAATVGMFSPPTAPSVGHRPEHLVIPTNCSLMDLAFLLKSIHLFRE